MSHGGTLEVLQDVKRWIDPLLIGHINRFGLPQIQEAARHAVLLGGKRLRPGMVLLMGRSAGLHSSFIDRIGIAVEFLHAASLVHDDLPALDNDDTRRGVPTLHRVFGEGKALLVGDLLVAKAFEVVCELPDEASGRLSRELSFAFVKLCVGQVDDIDPTAAKDWDGLQRVYSNKTGALFSACLVAPLLVADAPTKTIDLAREVGRQFGITFQVVDDYIDRYGASEQRGRDSSSDERNNKVTSFSDRSAGMARLQSCRTDLLNKINMLGASWGSFDQTEFTLLGGLLLAAIDRVPVA